MVMMGVMVFIAFFFFFPNPLPVVDVHDLVLVLTITSRTARSLRLQVVRTVSGKVKCIETPCDGAVTVSLRKSGNSQDEVTVSLEVR